jgi:hypothetical protein
VADDLASQARWTINSTIAGNKQIKRMQSYDVADDSSTEAQGEVGSTSMVGFTAKPGGLMISFEIMETRGTRREIDWERLKVLDNVFSLTKQVKGGQRTQYPECKVSKIDYTGDVDGKHSYTVEIVALSQKAM